MNPDPPLDLSCPLSAIPASPFCRSCFPFIHSCLTLLSIMLPFNRSWIHQLDRGRVTVRRSSGTITPYLVAQRCRTVLKGGTYGLFCRPKVPCGTQRQHLRLILSPKGAVRHSKATLTAYSVAQRCRATLKGGTYGDFSSPESTATNYPVSKMRRFAHENDSEDSPVSRMRRFAHEMPW